MKKQFGILMVLLATLFILPGCVLGSNAPLVMVNDIKSQPSKYYNTTVKISGLITNVIPQPEGTSRGTYSLSDDDEGIIIVKSNSLPTVWKDKEFVVVGMVKNRMVPPDTEAQTFILHEINRGSSIFPLGLLLASAGILLILIIILLYLNLDHLKSKKATYAYADSPAKRPDDYSFADKEKTIYEASPKAYDFPTDVGIDTGLFLVITEGIDKGRKFDLNVANMTLGRKSNERRKNYIEFSENETKVSREQGILTYNFKDKVYHLANESEQVILVNNKELCKGEKIALAVNDLIILGNGTVKMKLMHV